MADPVSALLVVGLVYAVPIAAATVAPYLRRRRQVASARARWSAFAQRHGLTGGDSVEGDPLRLWYGGEWKQRQVSIAGGITLRGGWTNARILFHPPLDLGLRATARGAMIWDPFRYDLEADEPERAKLVMNLEVTEAARALSGTPWAANDVGTFLIGSTFLDDPMDLESQVDRVIAFADAIDRARAAAPPASPLLPVAGEWERHARENGLAFGTVPLSMSGSIDGVRVAAFTYRADKLEYGVGAYAYFDEPLAGAVGLAPHHPGSLAFWLGVGQHHPGAEDWVVGDPVFDDTFIVKARDPSRLEKLLPPPLRQELVSLNERTPLVIDDTGLRIATRALPPPASIPRLLRRIAAAAGEIQSNVRGRAANPYR